MIPARRLRTARDAVVPSDNLDYDSGMRQDGPYGGSGSALSRRVCSGRRFGWLGLGIGGLAVLVGCEARFGSYRAAIQAADPNERIRGIKAAGDAKDRHAVPLLVDRLEDEDEAVRFFAIIALGKITGQRFGYDYAVPADQRAPAVERWREYVQRGALTATAPAGGAARIPARWDDSSGTAGLSEPVPGGSTAPTHARIGEPIE